MYKVYCVGKTEDVYVWKYWIGECEAERLEYASTECGGTKKVLVNVGDLCWGDVGDATIVRQGLDVTVHVIKRTGRMVSSPVTPEEAETITGLAFPACMDRLRELVHETQPIYDKEGERVLA